MQEYEVCVWPIIMYAIISDERVGSMQALSVASSPMSSVYVSTPAQNFEVSVQAHILDALCEYAYYICVCMHAYLSFLSRKPLLFCVL